MKASKAPAGSLTAADPASPPWVGVPTAARRMTGVSPVASIVIPVGADLHTLLSSSRLGSRVLFLATSRWNYHMRYI
jgi:hypothetical protein